jgi:hypothetical protein
LIDTITAGGYRSELVHVTCEIKKSWGWNVSRGPDNISAYYTEPFHMRWIMTALEDFALSRRTHPRRQ